MHSYASPYIVTHSRTGQIKVCYIPIADTFVDFYPLASMAYLFVTLLGILIFLNMLLLLNVLQANPRLRVFSKVHLLHLLSY
jgi:hypothetical protein